jgi:hypothetical protein
MKKGKIKVLDPLVAKALKNERYNAPRDLSRWLAEQIGSPVLKPEGTNFVVVGGETNPIWQSTGYIHYRTAPVDKWIPKKDIKLDEKPLRMPAGLACADGTCGIEL